MKKQLNKKCQTAAAVFKAVFVCFFILSFSIAVPILFRPFYYWHIDAYDLTESGFSKIHILEGFNSLLDYCTFKTDEFSVGIFKFSTEGASHFADCRRLFLVDFLALAISAFGIVSLFVLRKLKLTEKLRLGRLSASF